MLHVKSVETAADIPAAELIPTNRFGPKKGKMLGRSIFYKGHEYRTIVEFSNQFKQNDTMFHSLRHQGKDIDEIGAIFEKRLTEGKIAPKFRESHKPKPQPKKSKVKVVSDEPKTKTKKLTFTANQLEALSRSLRLQEELIGIEQTLTLEVVVK